MRRLKRLHVVRLAAFAVLFAAVLSGRPTHAQSEPTALIDSIFADLSQQLGRTLTRANVDNWTWTDDVYTDSSLGCPRAGQSTTPGSVHGYKVIIVYNGVTYDYRTPKGTSAFFRCSPLTIAPIGAASAIPPTAIPTITVVPTAAPIVPTIAPIAPIAPTVAPVIVPTNPPPVMLSYISPDGNLHTRNLATGADTPLTTDAAVPTTLAGLQPVWPLGRSYRMLAWSPDAARLLYYEVTTGAVYVTAPGQKPILLLTPRGPFNGPIGADWSPDGSQVAIIVDGKIQIFPAAGGAPQTIWQANGGCGGSGDGAPNDPSSWLLMRERIPGAAPFTTLLIWTAHGIVHDSEGCSHFMLIDPTGNTLWTADGASNLAVFSSDRTKAAWSLSGNNIALLDMTTGMTRMLPVNANGALLQSVGWTADGQGLLFSTLDNADSNTVSGTANSALGAQLFHPWPLSATTDTVRLWRMPISGGAASELLRRQGYSVGLINAPSDGSGVAFSFVTSSIPLVQAINAGKSISAITAVAPHVEIDFFNYESRVLRVVTLGGQPVFAPSPMSGSPASAPLPVTATSNPTAIIATFTAIPLATSTLPSSPVANCPGAPPSRLTVGSTARVTPGDPNDLRDSPAGQSIGKVPGGAAFGVLSGPVCGANGIAWWQVNYNGQVGWTAEGQGVTYYLEP